MENVNSNNTIMSKDEDFPAVVKKKSRNPKPRDKWSLLWFIPSQVLNSRDDVTDAKGRFVKRGKRLGFDRFNQLNCKVCRKVFHKYQTLAFHTNDVHGGRVNPSPVSVSRSPSFQPAAVKRIQPDPIRRSNRVTSLKPVSYDDDIEILEIDVSPIKPKDVGEQKFGKLSLAAQRKLVEENSKEETKSKETGPSIRIKHIVKEEPKNKDRAPAIKSKLQITKVPAKTKDKIPAKEIEVIDIDMDDDEPKAATESVVNKNASSNISKKDEEILLTKDDDVEEKEYTRKRKLSSTEMTQTEKKLKSTVEKNKPSVKIDETQTEKKLSNTGEIEKQDLIEVKSSSGKSMFVSKAALEKIMVSKSLQAAVAKKVSVPSNDEKTDITKTESVVDTSKKEFVADIEMSEAKNKHNITTEMKLSPVGRKITRSTGN